MPRGDKTGPNGDGPRTGRGLGDCSTSINDTSKRNIKDGRGRGIRRGGY